MNAFVRLALMAASLPLASCSSVVSERIIGDTPHRLDPQRWNAVWADSSGQTLVTRVKDAPAGILEVAYLDLEPEAIEKVTCDVHIRAAGGWLWASFKDRDEEAFTIGRVGEPDKELLAWAIDPRVVARLVRSGTVAGRLLTDEDGRENGRVVLGGLGDAELEQIRAGRWGDLFRWDSPALILRRVSD